MNPPLAQPDPGSFRTRIPGGPVLALILGIVLPVVALGVELGTGMSRSFFDPIPSPGHVLAVAFVPLAHLLGLLALRSRTGGRPLFSPATAARLNSAALAIGLVYALCYALVTPFAFVGILAFGIGLLPLAPLASVIAAMSLRKGLRRQAGAAGLRLPALWPGFSAGLLLLAALESPALITARGVHQLAEAGSPPDEAAALRCLRLLGSEEHLLRGCYENAFDNQRGWLRGLVAGAATPAACQLAYYRVTGHPYNSVPAPRSDRGFGGRGETDDWVWDASLGDQQAGQRLRALHLTESRLDARLEGDPALGYLEWTLVFRNDHSFQQREARALVQLPPGAVVSRLTLWVHGEEREAAFAGRAQVIQAYKAVVSQRRDPVLVTAQGPDRVLVQCFPLEPRGGLMKIRLGITTPLPLARPDRAAHLLLPRFIEQNFSVPSTFRHHLWVEADAPLVTPLPALLAADTPPGRHALHGVLSPAEFAAPRSVLTVTRHPGAELAWTPSPGEPGRVVTQVLGRQAGPAGPVVLVLSGSAELAPAAAALASALEAAGRASPFARLLVAGDTLAASPAGTDAYAQARWLRAQSFAGGQDDTTALSDAVEQLVEGTGDGTLVWLHGAQPVAWQNPEALEQRLAHRAAGLRVLAVPAAAGPNLLLEKLAAGAPVVTYPRLTSLPGDLTRLLRELQEGAFTATRSLRPADNDTGTAPAGIRASDQLARLWAGEEVGRLLATASPADREAARRLAVGSRIVTPVSGAVVLETQAQYDAAGLSPSAPGNAPAVPEPATCGLLMAGAALVFVVLRRRRLRGPA